MVDGRMIRWSPEILIRDFLSDNQSSSLGEFHPQALTEPDVTVSRHPAPIIQSPFIATLPCFLAPPIAG